MKRLFFGVALAIVALASVSWARGSSPIAVYPQDSALEIGSTLQCTAYVPLTPDTVQWLVNGIKGGNATVGRITTNGLYTAPAVVPVTNVVMLQAQSTMFPSIVGASPLTLTRPTPWLWSVYPAKLQSGNYKVTLNGANFAPDSVASANGVDALTTYVSPTALTVQGAATVGTLTFVVRQPGNGGVVGNGVFVPVVASIVSVAVSPTAASVPLGGSRAFTAKVTGNANAAVSWTVNGLPGGAAKVGLISTAGVYTAPTASPGSNTVTLRAVSAAVPGSFAQAVVTLTPPPPPPVTVAVTPASVSVQFGKTQAFSATVHNSSSTAVVWSVNGAPGGSTANGLISSNGVYFAPPGPPAGAITVQAVSVASPSSLGTAAVTLVAPPPAPVWLTGARFLEQSSFGPTPITLAEIKQVGIGAFLQQQLALPETPIFVPPDNNMGTLQQWVLYNYTTAPDQLRQRVAYALSQILVTSDTKLIYAEEMIPWLRLLSKYAFGNYRSLLRDMTLCPSMGKYLDLANSQAPGMSGGANENYAREVMQLFTIGVSLLNTDGSVMLDPQSQQPMPTYDQFTVQQAALALTGWTYATAPGAVPQPANWEYFGAPMEARPSSHATSAKTILGVTIPAGRTPEQDLDAFLDILMNHPNTGPFIVTRLIRSLVTSNPSPGFIERIAAVFADNGVGVRGDLKAVVSAILMDPEARQDVAPADGGRLKEPILQISGLLRALGGGYTTNQGVTYLYDSLAQSPLGAPSVFGWFSPLYHLPKSPLFGPEFQVYTGSEAVMRGNLFYYLITSPDADAAVDLTPFQPYGNDMNGLVEAANQALLYGRMDPAMKTVIANSAAPGWDAPTRITTVLYLTALSGQYAVQY